jgi:uncharacterized membrane protein
MWAEIYHVHPMLVHFPIALLTAAVLCDYAYWLGASPVWEGAGRCNLFLGVVAALVAIWAGFVALPRAPHPAAADDLLTIHTALNLTASALFLGLGAWRLWRPGVLAQPRGGPTFLVVGLVATGVLWTGASYGGRLVFDEGAAVRPAATRAGVHRHATPAPLMPTSNLKDPHLTKQ